LDVITVKFPRGPVARAGSSLALAGLACAALASASTAGTAAVGDTATSLAGATLLPGGTLADGSVGQQTASQAGRALASATLEQCATATAPQTERSATFTGEMTATTDTAHMELRIAVEERALGEATYRTVTAPGLGVWHSSAAGVKIFAHIQQVTNLSAPALYRGAIRFRWLNAAGRVIKSQELLTASCEQPPAESPATGAGQSTTSSPTGT
jgi:hypothetical protein